MSNYNRFFKENVKQVDTTKKVIISNRFTDEEGKIEKWILKPLKKSEQLKLADTYLQTDLEANVSGDTQGYLEELIGKSVINPNLYNEDLQNSYGVMGVFALLDEMLTTEEFDLLIKEVNTINGFNKNTKNLIKEAKN